eukprot:Skav204016  [mRNA]  locus=scaffold3530:5749:7164:- [translate_table: standard]
MQSLKRSIAASQQFLTGVRTLSTYAALEARQHDGLLRAFSRVSAYNPTEAADVLSLLDNTLWTAQSLEAFQNCVAEKTLSVVEAGRAPRRLMQDFLTLPKLLTQDLMAMVLDSTQDRQFVLQQMCLHAAKLSLRCPTERSLAVLLALSHFPSMEISSEQEQLDLLDRKREKIRKYLRQHESKFYLVTLPEDFEDLPPDLRKLVFSEGKPAVDQDLITRINHLSRVWCLRVTNQGLLRQASTTSEENIGTMVRNAVKEAIQERAEVPSSSNVALRVLPVVPEQQPVASAGGDKTFSRLPLAIEDKKPAEAEVSEEKARDSCEEVVKEKPKMTVEQQLAALKASSSGSTGNALKRPASAKAGAKKKPAGFQHESHEALEGVSGAVAAEAVCQDEVEPSKKRKGPTSKRGGPPAKKPAARSAGSAGVGTLPKGNGRVMPSKAVRVRMMPNGCSTCREVPGCTPSCWLKKGWIRA